MNREYTIDQFTYLPDISDEIDRLVELAGRSRDRKEKQKHQAAARSLIAIYEKHIGRKVYNQI